MGFALRQAGPKANPKAALRLLPLSKKFGLSGVVGYTLQDSSLPKSVESKTNGGENRSPLVLVPEETARSEAELARFYFITVMLVVLDRARLLEQTVH